VRAALHAKATRSVRLRAQLFPPSTVHWLAASFGERIGRIMDAVDDTISLLTHPVRRATR